MAKMIQFSSHLKRCWFFTIFVTYNLCTIKWTGVNYRVWRVWQMYTHLTISALKFRTFPLPVSSLITLSRHFSFSLPAMPSNHFWILSQIFVLLLLEPRTLDKWNYTLSDFFLSTWFWDLSVLLYVSMICFFLLLSSISLHEYISLFNHSRFEGHLGYFQSGLLWIKLIWTFLYSLL